MITQTEVRRHPLWREEVASTTRSDVPQRIARLAGVIVALVVLGLVAGFLAIRSALPAG